MANEKYMGQEILGQTYLPRGGWARGRLYFMMKDGDGTIYLVKENDGLPDFS